MSNHLWGTLCEAPLRGCAPQVGYLFISHGSVETQNKCHKERKKQIPTITKQPGNLLNPLTPRQIDLTESGASWKLLVLQPSGFSAVPHQLSINASKDQSAAMIICLATKEIWLIANWRHRRRVWCRAFAWVAKSSVWWSVKTSSLPLVRGRRQIRKLCVGGRFKGGWLFWMI